MKKILSLLLAGTLVFGLAACGDDTATPAPVEKSAYEIYETAQEKIEDTGELAADMDMNMSFTITMADMEPVSMDSKMTGSMKQVMKSDSDLELSMQMTVESMDTVSEMNSYYTDGYYYTQMEGVKYKVQMDMEDALETIENMNNSDFDLDEEAIISSEVTEENGITTAKILVDGDKMSDDVREMMSALEDMVGAGDYNMTFDDIDMTLTVDEEGNMQTSDVNMKMTITIPDNGTNGEMSASMNMQMLMTVTATENVTVDFPTDLETYEDYTEFMQYEVRE